MKSKTHKVAVIAHRGARSLAPENTLAAARRGYEVGADMWETDVAVTADGELILFHDDSLARTTDAAERFPDRAPWTFTTFTLAEIRTLDAGSWFVRQDPYGQIAAGAVDPATAASYIGERVPTVREALQLTKELNWCINLELKRQPAPQEHFPLVDAVLKVIDEVHLPDDQIIISSFNHAWLRQVAAMRPRIECEALVGFSKTEPLQWEKTEFGVYNVRYTLITPEEMRALAARGVAVNLFTVNDEEAWRQEIEAGAVGIITDFPQKLIAMLEANSL
ncbi:MAG: glycerophosphodiester phosphodiesterase [Caldilineae bacterium]|nr:MAG: glycerophosphodiester phosphodiesterase [Caldilineae bacterium]